jgi:hypothetical protein
VIEREAEVHRSLRTPCSEASSRRPCEEGCFTLSWIAPRRSPVRVRLAPLGLAPSVREVSRRSGGRVGVACRRVGRVRRRSRTSDGVFAARAGRRRGGCAVTTRRPSPSCRFASPRRSSPFREEDDVLAWAAPDADDGRSALPPGHLEPKRVDEANAPAIGLSGPAVRGHPCTGRTTQDADPVREAVPPERDAALGVRPLGRA